VVVTSPAGQQYTVLAEQLAPGGTDGQLLVKDAAQPTGQKWASGAGGGGPVSWTDILSKPSFAAVATSGAKADVGLGNVDNTADTAKPVSTAAQTALDLKAPLAGPTFTGTVSGITKAMVGLPNADNTSDANKPVSTATQTALNLKEAVANKSTSTTLGTSDTLYPSQNAVKTYVDAHSGGATSSGAATAIQGSNGSGGLADTGCTATSGTATCPNGFISGTSGVGIVTMTAGTAPTTPASGKTAVYSDSTQKGLSVKDDAGQVTRTVKPTACSGGTPVVSAINADGTVTCAADASGGTSGWIAAPTPTFSPVAGTYSSTQNVSVTCAAGTAYYSTDGATVAAFSTPVTVATTSTIMARCFNTGYDPGIVATAAYTISGTSYVGPGDIVASTLPWYGMRAYSLAAIGTRMVRICNAGEANCADIVSLSNGDFDVATAQGAPLNCGGSGGTCTIKYFYDQNITNACGGTCDIMTIVGSSPTLTFNAIGTKAGVTWGGSTWSSTNNLSSALTQPLSFSVVAKGTGGAILGSAGYSAGVTLGGGSATIYSGASLGTAASDTTFHAVNGLFNSASSSIRVDGTTVTGDAGTRGVAEINLSGSDSTWQFAGVWLESAYLAGDASASFAALESNQRAYWGF
jgi:hypothetical protein